MPRFASKPARALALLTVPLMSLAAQGSRADASTPERGSIEGRVWEDLDRDRTPDPDERLLADHQLLLLDGAGTYVGTTLTGPDGRYRFDVAAPAAYVVEVAPSSWAPLKSDWTTSTTPDWRPRQPVSVAAGSAVAADFGWRRIVRSTDPSRPLSTWRGPDGPRIDVYDDAVPASAVGELLLAGGLIGDEAAATTIRLDLSTGSSTAASWQQVDGRLSNYQATVWIDWYSWLNTTETTLFHEYGHAWAGYWSVMGQQDPSLAGYLEARGLTGDARVDSSYGWGRAELVAEDYRQLFGSPGGRAAAQANSELPPAASVAGLGEYLAGPFRQYAPTPDPTPPDPAPTLTMTEPEVSPTPVVRSATISVSLSADADLRVDIRDRRGRVVRVLADGPAPAGTASMAWDRRDASGRSVRKGTYSVVATASNGLAAVTTSTPFAVS